MEELEDEIIGGEISIEGEEIIIPEINIPVIQGEKGEKGDSNTLTIGTVTKGEEASAEITGESPNQILNLVLPKGDKGEKGEQGIPGEKGADGQDGQNGQNGQDGYTPIKGTDYFTEAEQREFKNGIMQQINPEIEAIESTANNALDKANTTETIAKGRATGYVFDTKANMDAWLENEDNLAKLVLGDNLYIRAIGVPDYWWDGTNAQQLETQKVDLTEYYKKDETYNKNEVDNKVDNIQALPVGGTTGQVLTKKSNSDRDADWGDNIAVKNTSSTSQTDTYSCAKINEMTEDIYSTEEQVIGKWIDGKSIYRKVVETKTPNAINTDANLFSLANVATITHLSAMTKDAYGYVNISVPFAFNANNMGTIFYNSTTKNVQMNINNNAYKNATLYVIVEYTKTTD